MTRQLSLSLLTSAILLALSGCGSSSTSTPSATNDLVTSIQVDTVVNNTPVATFETFTINRDVTYNGQLTAVDHDNDKLTYALTSNCKHGSVTVDENGCFTYVPDDGYEGSDSFSYKVKDALSTCPNKKVTIDVTQKPVATPAAPSNLRLEALSTCKIHVSWDDNADNETGFEIYKDGQLASVVNANVTTVDLCGGMSPATTYEIAVAAKNAAGSSAMISSSVTTKDITTPPAAPTDLKALAVDKTSVRLGWVDNADNESAYDIYVNGKWQKVIDSNCHCSVITGLEPGKTYTFQVTAKNKIGSAPSKVISVTTKAEPVVIVDAKPTIALNGDGVVKLIIGDDYTESGASATDAEDGNLTATCVNDVNTSKEGSYQSVCTATDSAGQSVQVTRSIIVAPASSLNPWANIPYDSNLEVGGEKGIVYYVDPRPEEHGLNRALRIDYLNWDYTQLSVTGINPHSIDRAGDSDKFYIRTQNSFSFDVVNFKKSTVKTVDMGEHKPRAIGATNLKHHLQLMSVRNRQIIDVIDTKTDTIIASLGDETETPGITTGHALWFDDDHFGLIDRAKPQIVLYKVVDTAGVLSFVETDRVLTKTSLHAIERVADARTREDLVTFYGTGEGDIAKGGTIVPFITKFTFNPETGKLAKSANTDLTLSTAVVQGRPPVTHHAGISPDGKYFCAPVFDGHVYIIDRATMQVVKVLNAALGAAHIAFSPTLDLAIVTNHWSNEVTIIDLATLTVKKNIVISNTQEFHEDEPHLLQPHFSYLSADGKHYYTFATQDGDFLKINLETLEVEDTLHVGGAPEQAHS